MERLDNPLSDAELQEQEVLDNVQSMCNVARHNCWK